MPVLYVHRGGILKPPPEQGRGYLEEVGTGVFYLTDSRATATHEFAEETPGTGHIIAGPIGQSRTAVRSHVVGGSMTLYLADA